MGEPDILDEIVEQKRLEVARRREETPLLELQKLISRQVPPLDFAGALRGAGVKLIAEVKKASPSRGLLCPDFDPISLAKTYAENGAAAISVLTEIPHFQGSIEHLKGIKDSFKGQGPPVLRKDFLFHPFQIYESRAYGADALLLIAAILSPSELSELLALSRYHGMECLVEVHDEEELGMALGGGAEVIGINNRDLSTFSVDLETTRRLKSLIPPDKVVVAESGISSREDAMKLQEWGVDAILVGEALMTAPDIGAKVRELA